ncbi:MAG TPA: hypothetical protein VIR56_06145, partial [Solimonas sp.]
KLGALRQSAERAGRDPLAIVPAYIQICFLGDDAELAKILEAPLIKSLIMQFPGDLLKANGFVHPLGEDWRGYQDINPAVLPRERILDMLSKTRPEMLLAITPHGTPKQVARIIKGYVDAGLRVPKIMDYGGMAGLSYAASSAQKVREAEDELLKLCGDIA